MGRPRHSIYPRKQNKHTKPQPSVDVTRDKYTANRLNRDGSQEALQALPDGWDDRDEAAAARAGRTQVASPSTLHPAPYTIHPTPYTLCPAPYTLHTTPYALRPTPCALHSAPYTLRPTPCALHLRMSTFDAGRGARRSHAGFITQHVCSSKFHKKSTPPQNRQLVFYYC